jgi:hypothetical protein
MATKEAMRIALDDQSTLVASLRINGARNILELLAEQLHDEGSQTQANPELAADCIWGVIHLLKSAGEALTGARP